MVDERIVNVIMQRVIKYLEQHNPLSEEGDQEDEERYDPEDEVDDEDWDDDQWDDEEDDY